MIQVTKTFLPDFDKYISVLKRAWDKAWITNNGELVQELEQRLKDFLGVKNLIYTANGTLPLMMAIKALKLKGEIITTPFSYVATLNAILWEGCKPVFADIDRNTFCADPQDIERKITANTVAILITHVYGYPCDVDAIEKIAQKYNLKVIYDAAHAFGCEINGKSLLSFGDISTCSFHATKIFHTVEGGCICTENDELAEILTHYRQFGHYYDQYFSMGINAKNSEFHAAMGLCNLPETENIINSRKAISEKYHEHLRDLPLQYPSVPEKLKYNYAYFPVVFPNENQLLQTMKSLAEEQIFCRRYFYPSLNTLPFIDYQACPVSEDIAGRVLCLPLYYDLDDNIVETVTLNIKKFAKC